MPLFFHPVGHQQSWSHVWQSSSHKPTEKDERRPIDCLEFNPKGWLPLSRIFSVRTDVKFTCVNEIEALYERLRVQVKVDRGSTFTFTHDLLHNASILFTHLKITRQRTIHLYLKLTKKSRIIFSVSRNCLSNMRCSMDDKWEHTWMIFLRNHFVDCRLRILQFSLRASIRTP